MGEDASLRPEVEHVDRFEAGRTTEFGTERARDAAVTAISLLVPSSVPVHERDVRVATGTRSRKRDRGDFPVLHMSVRRQTR